MNTIFILLIIIGSNLKIKEAKKLFELGKIEESITLYERGLNKLRGYKKIEETLNFIDLLIRTERFDKALDYLLDLEEGVSRFSMLYPDILYRKALIYENMGNLIDAQKIYEKILIEYPKSKVFEYANKKMDEIFKKLIGDYIASVGSKGITYEEFNRFIEDLPPMARPSLTDTAAVKRILKNYITWKILYFEALKQKLDLSPEFTEEKKKTFEKLLAQYFIETTNKSINVSEDEIKKYYLANREEFKIPSRWDLRRIEVKREEEARELLSRLKKGENFEELAKNYSIAPDAKNGGLIKNFTEKSIPGEFVKFLKLMKEGEVRGPIKLENGNFAIIKLIKAIPGKYKSLEEVKKDIKEKIKRKKSENFWEEWRNRKLKEYEVKYYISGDEKGK